MTYAQARRAARSMLGPSAELNLMSKAPALKYQVGVRVEGKLVFAGAGNSWVEALRDAKHRLSEKETLETSPLEGK